VGVLSQNSHEAAEYEQEYILAEQIFTMEKSAETQCMIATSMSGIVRTCVHPHSDKVQPAFKRILTYLPMSTYDYHCRALAHRMLNNMAGAFAEYTTAIELYPQIASLYLGRSGTYPHLIDDLPSSLRGAIEDLTKAIFLGKFENGYPSARMARAQLLALSGDHKGAILDQQVVVKLMKYDPWAYIQLASLKEQMGDLAGACVDMAKAKGLHHEVNGLAKRYGNLEMINSFSSRNKCP